MIISPIGYGGTGSGAVFDLLKEVDGLQIAEEMEFTYSYSIDGLEDLQYHLIDNFVKSTSGDAAIKRFLESASFAKVPFMRRVVPKKAFLKLTNEYVDSITQASFIGWENIDFTSGTLIEKIFKMGIKKFIAPMYQKTTNKSWNIWPARKIYISIEPDDFLEKSKKYLRQLLAAADFDLEKPIVLNQAFAANRPDNSFVFFDNPKAIIVDRDPRDLYIQHQLMTSGEGRWLPRNNVNSFITQYKNIRKNIVKINDDTKLLINFEELIYDYDDSRKKILKFIDKELVDHSLKGLYFNPLKSVNNTRLFEHYSQFEEEIKLIENELSEYLFSFEKYTVIEKNGTPFNP